jgi:serine/threonine protein phosphatase PrpC
MPFTIGVASDKGDGSVQQDYIACTPDTVILCDGHGRLGHHFADAVCKYMAAAPFQAPTDLFRATATHVSAVLSGVEGGTTCTYVHLSVAGIMTVAHIGDSAVHYWDGDGTGTPTTADHSPCDLGEFKRVTAAGGMCIFEGRSKRDPAGPTFLPAADGTFEYNAAGVLSTKNVHGDAGAYLEGRHTVVKLAVTRSFGDYPLIPYGLSTEPCIITVPPPAAAVRAIVIASDGLWDVMKYEEIGAMVRSPTFLESCDAAAAAAALLAAALSAGRALFGPMQDNTTIAVVYLSV